MERHSKRLLSVVVSAFNEESMISISIQQINSILVENERNFEIIVCDDGSTDRTLLECLSLLRDIPLRVFKLGEKFWAYEHHQGGARNFQR